MNEVRAEELRALEANLITRTATQVEQFLIDLINNELDGTPFYYVEGTEAMTDECYSFVKDLLDHGKRIREEGGLP